MNQTGRSPIWRSTSAILIGAMLLYVVLLILVGLHHEPWADEAQAWLLARDSGLGELLFQRLRYEGHPGLWYAILFLPSKWLPYPTVNVIAGIIASLGVFLLLFRSPFPWWLRILFPFSYFLFYQYALIARSYVLLPTLLFLTAWVYPHKREQIELYALLACLLAVTTVYTALVAGVLMLLHLIDILKVRRELGREEIRQHAVAYLVFGSVLFVIAAQLWPAENGSFARGFHFSFARLWSLGHTVMNEILTERLWLSGLVLFASLIWFWHRRVLLIYSLSTLAVLALFTAKYYNSWHQGILFLIWVFTMWLSFGEQPGRLQRERLLQAVGIGTCLVVLLFHIYWTAMASWQDWRGSYSGGGAVADYIKREGLVDEPIYATTFWSTAIQPYFPRNIFANHRVGENAAYWFWAKPNGQIEDLEQILKDRPTLIVLGRPGDRRELPGYRFVGLFEGNLYWKDRIKEQNHLGVFRRE